MANANFEMTVADETANLLSFFQKRSLMSAHMHVVLDANLFDPHQLSKPDWYDPLVAHLDAVKAQAQRWLDVAAPSLTALPQNYVNFANAFDGQMPHFSSIMTDLLAGKGDPDTQLDSIETIFNEWIKAAQRAEKSAAASDAALKSFLADLATAIAGLTEGANSVNAAILVDKQAVIDITSAIAGLQGQLRADINAAIAANSASLAVLIAFVVGVVIAVGTGGTAAIVGAIVAGVALAAGLVGTIITSLNIVNDQNAIIEKYRDLSDENQQIVVLNGVALTLDGLVNIYKDDGFQAGDLASTWTDLATNLQAVRDLVIAERTDAHGLKQVLADINDFQSTADTLRTLATQLQTAALSADALPVAVQTIPLAIAA